MPEPGKRAIADRAALLAQSAVLYYHNCVGFSIANQIANLLKEWLAKEAT